MFLGEILSILFFVELIVGSSISSNTIERDLNEITKLHKEFLDRSPLIPAHQAYEVRCRAIKECCPDEEENLYEILSESQFNEKCLSNGTKLARSTLSSSCLVTLRQLIELTKEPIYNEYFHILGSNGNRLNRIKTWKKQMKLVCSQEELDGFYCQRNNLELFKSCQRKVFQMILKENEDDDGTIYKTYVSQIEQEYAIDNQKLAKAFPKV